MRKLTIPPSLINTINADPLFHFLDLKTNQASVGVSVSVILNQESKGFIVATLGEEPTGRLWDEPHEEDDEDTGEALQDEGNTPLVVVADMVCSVSNRSSGDTASEPTTVIET